MQSEASFKLPELDLDHKITDEQIAYYLRLFHSRSGEIRREMIAAAQTARNLAISHRQFKVGAALMGVDETGEIKVYSGFNNTPKPHQEGDPPRPLWEKKCAESIAIEEAVRDGCIFVVALVTVSDKVATDDQSKAHSALHPCLECRIKLRQLIDNGRLRSDSVMVNVKDNKEEDEDRAIKEVEEERTIGELLAKYADDPKVDVF